MSSGVSTAAARGDPDDGSDDESPAELGKDEVFDVLRNGRRRAAVASLRAAGGELSVRELTERVAADEYDVPAAELSSEQSKRVYTGLYQCHLPRMAELGVVEFDTEENVVRLDDGATALEPYHDAGTGSDGAYAELGVAATVAVVAALSSLDAGPFAVVPLQAVAALTIAALLGLALLQLYE